MKKMYINRFPVNGPYGGGNNFVRALYEYSASNGIVPTNQLTDDVDVIFVIDPRYDQTGLSINEISTFKSMKPSTKIFYRINECDQRKGDVGVIDPLIAYTSQFCDACIFISDWIMNYHVKPSWMCDKNYRIYSGTNKSHFKSGQKLQNDKINLVTHHWSDNPLKGQDIYESLDSWLANRDDFTFTYIGRTKANLKNATVIGPMYGAELGTALSKYDVYISGSRFDPGPNHIIESLSCEIPTYAHIDSGGAVEMVGDSHIFESFNHLKQILERKEFERNSSLKTDSWETCMSKYFDVIMECM